MNINSFIDIVIDLLKEKQKLGYDLKDVLKDLKEMKK